LVFVEDKEALGQIFSEYLGLAQSHLSLRIRNPKRRCVSKWIKNLIKQSKPNKGCREIIIRRRRRGRRRRRRRRRRKGRGRRGRGGRNKERLLFHRHGQNVIFSNNMWSASPQNE
jgi:hypothetical protein